MKENDYRKQLPRYQGEHWKNNQKLVAEFAEMAVRKKITPAQLALAWILAQGENIIPIPGTKRINNLEENAGAVEAVLSFEDMACIEKILGEYPNVGNRYNPHDFQFVNK